MLRVAIAGAAGRMGRAITLVLSQTEGVELTAAFEHPGSNLLGQDVGEIAGCGRMNVPIESNMAQKIEHFDLLIDFTLPDSTMEHLRLCVKTGRSMVIGATGLTAEQQAEIDAAGKKVPLVQAANYSVGINLMLKLVSDAAKVLGTAADLEVFESHHRDKVDAPSGTAIELGRALASARGWDFDQCATFTRSGHTGIREPDTIGFSTLRGGDIVGEHTVFYVGLGERLEITHKASDRLILARGAVLATMWLKNKGVGLYSMQDVLGL